MSMWRTVATLDGRQYLQRKLYTMPGTGARWDNPTDPTEIVAQALNGQYWDWQGVDYPAATFPMGKSVDAGVSEHLRLLDQKDPNQEWGGVYYSQSGIIARKIYKATRPGQPYERHGKTLKVMVIFGPPCRQLGVANGNKFMGSPLPGSNTRGISDDCWNDADPEPDWIYDFVHPGDIYGEVANNDVGEDMTMIFKIVQDPLAGIGIGGSVINIASLLTPGTVATKLDFSSLTSVFGSGLGTNPLSDLGSLFGLGKASGGVNQGQNTAIEQIQELLTSPLRESPAAIMAIFNGLKFVAGGPWPTYPHTSYPQAGDCDAAIRLLTQIGATVPIGA